MQLANDTLVVLLGYDSFSAEIINSGWVEAMSSTTTMGSQTIQTDCIHSSGTSVIAH